MLLFSTMLEIKDKLDVIGFIDLLLKANQGYTAEHKNNIIPENELQWDGKSLDNNFGHDGLSLSTIMYRNGNILAARFEKKELDGKDWTTDYIWNIDEKKICIRLDRSFSVDSTASEETFSPPSFIKNLIAADFLADDCNLPISSDPVYITSDNIDLLINAINGTISYHLPIVYVSRTFSNEEPLDTSWLANRLSGIAHVFVESTSDLDFDIRKNCNDKYTYDGCVCIYFPQKAFGDIRLNLHHEYDKDNEKFTTTILNEILHYTNNRIVPYEYTWDGLNIHILLDRLSSSKEKRAEALSERDEAISERDVYDQCAIESDETVKELSQKLADQYNELEKLRATNEFLSSALEQHSIAPISLNLGKIKDHLIEEFFPGEAKEVLLEAIAKVLPNYEGQAGHTTRRHDILQAILDNNDCPNTLIVYHEKIKDILNGYQGMTAPIEGKLKKLGFTQASHEDHYKFKYHDDMHYIAVLPSTPGAQNSGAATADEIIKEIF